MSDVLEPDFILSSIEKRLSWSCVQEDKKRQPLLVVLCTIRKEGSPLTTRSEELAADRRFPLSPFPLRPACALLPLPAPRRYSLSAATALCLLLRSATQ